jgi:asparagine synthase (glutamine-hydrolysing)
MCGIALSPKREQTEAMLAVLAHRGRDDRQIAHYKGQYLGFNRLAIVAPGDEGIQPTETNHGVLALNGEIYNWQAIRDLLPELPYYDSEASVVCALIDLYPHGFWRHLDGSYALVYIDKRRNQIIASRDFLGIIPLYHYKAMFASERKAFLALHCQSLRAGETIWMNFNGRISARHQQDYYSMHLAEADLFHVEQLFRAAVRKRIEHSTRPVSVALSGGIDSALVMRAALDVKRDIEAITIQACADSYDAINASRLAAEWGFAHRVVTIDERLNVAEMERSLECSRSNPIKWRGFVRNYFVAKYATGTVILCGEGADELGCGYPSHDTRDGLALEWKRLSTVKSMPSINLDRVNLGGMAWTKEYRTPFLDRELVLYVMGCRALPHKELWRALAKRMGVPDYILDKPKYTHDEVALEQTRC